MRGLMRVGCRWDRGSTTSGALAGAAAVVLVGMAAALGYLVLGDDKTAPTPPPVVAGVSSPQAGASPSPSGPPDLTTLFARVQDGVVRVEVTTCFGSGTGSGALVAPDLVLTAAHVVEGATSVQLLVGTSSSLGTVIGLLTDRDLALVRSERAFDGHLFDVRQQTPDVGTSVIALGYPLSGGLSLTGPGVVSAHDEEVDYGGPTEVDGLMRTNLLTNRGNSGGPVLDTSGVLVGLVSGGAVSSGVLDPTTGVVAIDDVNGIKYAVPAAEISLNLARWRTSPEPPEPTECETGAEPDRSQDADLVTALVEAPEAEAVVATLSDYAEGINTSDYARAHAQLSPAQQRRIPYDEFREQQDTSFLSDVVVAQLVEQDDGLRATTIFTSRQDSEFGPDGLTCALWILDYALTEGGPNGWQIDGAAEVPGQPQFQPCEADGGESGDS